MKKLRVCFYVLIISMVFTLLVVSCKKNEESNNSNSSVTTTMTFPVSTEKEEKVEPATTNTEVKQVIEQQQTTSDVVYALEPVNADLELPVENPSVPDSPEFIANVDDNIIVGEITPVESDEVVDELYSDVVCIDPSFIMGNLTFNDDGSITDYYRYGLAVQAKVTVGSDYLEILYMPATITGDDIYNFIEECSKEFPQLVDKITYEITTDRIVFYFAPELMGGKYFKLYTLDYLNTVITKILDETNHVDAVYMSVNEENEHVFSTEFELFGKACYVYATKTNAEIHSGIPFTTEEMDMIVGVCLAVNPDLQYAEYVIEGECLKVSYPEVSDLYIKNAISTINNLIKAYTPVALPMLVEIPVSTEVEVTTDSKVEESVIEEETIEIEKTEVPVIPAITIVETPMETIDPATVAGKKVSFNSKLGIATSFGKSNIDFGVLVEGEAVLNKHFGVGLKTGYNLVSESIPFIPYVKGSFGNAYLQAGAGFSVAPFESSKFAGLLEVSVGYEFPLEDQFSVFAEAGVRLTLNGENKPNLGGFAIVGGNIKF